LRWKSAAETLSTSMVPPLHILHNIHELHDFVEGGFRAPISCHCQAC
jgi:hypothetical protein